jgi:hypothetical protein
MRKLFWLVVLLFSNISPLLAADEPPTWLRQAASLSLPAYDKEAKAVTLVDDTKVMVSEDGKIVKYNTHAIKILNREGRQEAVARTAYNTESEKVKDIKAWLIRPSGQIVKYAKEQIMDRALRDNDVYNEARLRMISGVDEAEPGAIFGYEVTVESKEIFSQFDWDFGSDHPVVASSISITVPNGWRAKGIIFNHPNIEPVINGSTYTWQAQNLEGVKDESASPSIPNLVPRIVVSIFPGSGQNAGVLRTFESWVDVSKYLSELADPQVQLDDALAGKARELTANAKTEFEKIQALGKYAQNIKYVSIQIGVGRGGGHRPHSSLDVFKKSYGDCKDKANLMRAMLRALNINAYPVVIYSGDPTFVREEIPSLQFNHCIIAIKVSAETKSPTIITHPKLGRLLIFDATDDDTPVGDLPFHEQGSFALIVAGADGALMRMPSTAPEVNKLVRKTDVTLSPEGAITAILTERSIGQSAVEERGMFKGLARPEYEKRIERWITRGATGAKISKISPVDNQADGKFALDVDFTATNYAQLMRGKLLVFKPSLVSQRNGLDLTSPLRKNPIVLQSEAFSETVRVKLPEGFEIDEMPDATKLETAFGKFSTSYEVKDGHLIFIRNLEVQNVTIPASRYTEVRNFFGRINGAEMSPVVLAKK